jgi:hypothetical protein
MIHMADYKRSKQPDGGIPRRMTTSSASSIFILVLVRINQGCHNIDEAYECIGDSQCDATRTSLDLER